MSMKDYESLNHTKWDCKYHVVFIGYLRRYGASKKNKLVRQKGCKLEEGH